MAIVLKPGYIELVGKVKKTIATNIGTETVVINVEPGVPFAAPQVSADELVATGVGDYAPPAPPEAPPTVKEKFAKLKEAKEAKAEDVKND